MIPQLLRAKATSMSLPTDDGTAVSETHPGLMQDTFEATRNDLQGGGAVAAEEIAAATLAPAAGDEAAHSDPSLIEAGHEASLILAELQGGDEAASLGAELVAALNELVRLIGQ